MPLKKHKVNLIDTKEILSQFIKNNAHARIVYDDKNGKIIIERPWDTDDIKISLDADDEEAIRDLNNIVINPLFDAIIHIDINQAEFIYGFLDPNDKTDSLIMNRKFDVFLNGQKFTCSFKEPTNRILLLSKGFQRQPMLLRNRPVPQITFFRDYQSREISYIQKYFEHKMPRNFFIYPEKPINEVDLVKVARNINFIMRYYDRESPLIVIRQKDEKSDKVRHAPKQMIEDQFPNVVAIREMDDYLLQLLEIARETTPRFAFVYYYQVIEYAAFNYLDSKAKKDLRQLLRNPTVIECDDSDLSELFAFLCEKMENDDVKMQKIIEEYCNPSIIWKEIENDKDFFSKSIKFEGEVEVFPLIASDTTEETWKTMWMPIMYQYFTKIRNSIVHAREKRQSNVISPCEKNSLLISRILPIIRRTAEMIAIMKE